MIAVLESTFESLSRSKKRASIVKTKGKDATLDIRTNRNVAGPCLLRRRRNRRESSMMQADESQGLR
jgi:hypothetical protein